MSKRVLITGITGFLASHTALQLLEAGYTVTGSLRSMKRSDHIAGVLEKHGGDVSRLSFVELDLLKDEGWRDAVSGHDYLVHTASPFVTTMPKDPQVLIKPAVEGTMRAIGAGLDARVERIVLTSSLVAVAQGHDGLDRDLTEDDWSNLEHKDISAYDMAKTRAERKAWEMVEKADRKNVLTSIQPGFIMGPVLEEDIGTSGELIRKMMTGGFPGVPDITVPLVDVRDTAAMHVNALTHPEFAGKRCIAAGQSSRLIEIAGLLAEDFPQYAKKLPTRQLPDFLVRLVGLFDGDARSATKSLGKVYQIDPTQARKLLGREFISNRAAARDMAQSIIDLGLI